jgi:hypothetical protein
MPQRCRSYRSPPFLSQAGLFTIAAYIAPIAGNPWVGAGDCGHIRPRLQDNRGQAVASPMSPECKFRGNPPPDSEMMSPPDSEK